MEAWEKSVEEAVNTKGQGWFYEFCTTLAWPCWFIMLSSCNTSVFLAVDQTLPLSWVCAWGVLTLISIVAQSAYLVAVWRLFTKEADGTNASIEIVK